jgi:hypothetical protein
MTNLTLTINLDSLTATQLAALQIVVMAGIGDKREQNPAYYSILAAGLANCGYDYSPEFQRVSDFLLNLDKGKAQP